MLLNVDIDVKNKDESTHSIIVNKPSILKSQLSSIINNLSEGGQINSSIFETF